MVLWETAEHVMLYWTMALILHKGGGRSDGLAVSQVFTVLFNQLVVLPVVLWCLEDFIGDQSPQWTDWLWVYLVEALGFYWTHRLLHSHTGLYVTVHSHHHQWYHVVPWAAFDAHPVEHVLTNLIPVFLGPLWCGWSRPWIRLWAALATVHALWTHRDPSSFHGFHHRYQRGNYGVHPWCDKWAGTLI